MFLKLSFWTFALKFTNLLIKFQITGPLYCADYLPTLYFTLGISNLNPSLRDGLFPNLKLDRLQKVLNAAARVTCRVPRFDRITPTLIKLHWLPIKFRIQFKVAPLVYKALNGVASSYFTEPLQVKATGRYALRSNNQLLLQASMRTKCWTFGDRSFSVAAPKIWNSLPLDIKQRTSVDCFKSTLETFLFKLAYEQSLDFNEERSVNFCNIY